MRERFDAYGGSVDAVIGFTLEALCRARRTGYVEADNREEDDAYDDE